MGSPVDVKFVQGTEKGKLIENKQKEIKKKKYRKKRGDQEKEDGVELR